WELRPVNGDDFRYARQALDDLVEHHLLPEMRRNSGAADIVTETIGEVGGLVPMSVNEAEQLVRALTGDMSPATGVVRHRGRPFPGAWGCHRHLRSGLDRTGAQAERVH